MTTSSASGPYRPPASPDRSSKSLTGFGWVVPGVVMLVAGIVLRSVFAAHAASCNTLLGRVASHFSASTGCTAAKTGATAGTVLIVVGVLALIAAVAYGVQRYQRS